jgi:hypothetical protein
VNRYTFERAIKAKLSSQGCVFQDALSTEITLVFAHPKGGVFNIPRPTLDEGWTLAQLNAIERELQSWELDFLPLDYMM